MQQGDSSLEQILASIKSMMARDDAQRRTHENGDRSAGEDQQPETVASGPMDGNEAAYDLTEAEHLQHEPPWGESEAPAAAPAEALTRPATVEAIRQSLAALNWLGQPEDLHSAPPEPATVDALTRAMLRPMLAQWLDANLPALVERIVQTEIARILEQRD